MKRFVTIAVALVLLALGTYYGVYYEGIYAWFAGKEAQVVQAKTKGNDILLQKEDGTYENFEIKGVALSDVLPGKHYSNYAIDKETWMRWFEEIQDMGANTIRIYTIYDEAFYEAFYEYNENREEPLYLLQGIRAIDYANNSKDDAYGNLFYPVLKDDAYAAVDVVHGKRNIPLNGRTGSGVYRWDVSEWVLGYLVGSDWNAGTVAYTNHNRAEEPPFEGEYFSAGEEASTFEKMLAQIMDTMVSYETNKYGQQRLISFVNGPATDPFAYDKFYGEQLGKFVCMDAENIKVTDDAFTGYFAAYQVYDFCPNYADYFADTTKQEIQPLLMKLNKDYYNYGYTQLLAEYHTMPVVITGYSFSTSRGIDKAAGNMTETEQGEKIIAGYNDIVCSGCAGAFIETWQDIWGQTTWNTSYAADLLDYVNWHDVQSTGQGQGILAFEPGKEKAVCYVDGNGREWQEKTPVAENEIGKLYADYDAEYLYLYLQGENVTKDTKLYLPIDTNPHMGSCNLSSPLLNFSHAAEFVLCMQGENNTRLLVQERYDSMRENYLESVTGEDPYEAYPNRYSRTFVPIKMVLKNDNLLTPEMTALDATAQMRLPTFETGKFVCGNANPYSGYYNSLSDFCYGTDGVEIRIAWGLLNFSNPADMKIHQDYYENYGREDERISELYIGVGGETEKDKIEMAPVELQYWGEDVSYHERLKASYEIIKEGWVNR